MNDLPSSRAGRTEGPGVPRCCGGGAPPALLQAIPFREQRQDPGSARRRTNDDRTLHRRRSQRLARQAEDRAAPDVARKDGTRLGGEIAESFAYLMSTVPDYSGAVIERVRQTVRSFHQGNGNQAEAAIQRARDAAPAVNDRRAR